MVTKVFWAVLVLDIGALAVLAYLASRGPSSPDGAVGAWLMFIPPLILIVVTAVVLITRSDVARMAGICILGIPWIFIVLGPVYAKVDDYMAERRSAGDDHFSGPQRELAHAIKGRDAALVKTLIPLAGDLNRQYGEQTLLSFAVDNAPAQLGSPVPGPTLEIVRALLAAGASVERAVGPGTRWPLSSAISTGPELTEMLLNAGANPNHLDDVGRPLWWQVLPDDTDRGLQTLKVLLDHGADVKIRDGEGGPVGWAAYHARAKYHSSWRAVSLLIERGAAWKDEQEFGQPVATMLARDFEDRQGKEISEEMRKLREKFGDGPK